MSQVEASTDGGIWTLVFHASSVGRRLGRIRVLLARYGSTVVQHFFSTVEQQSSLVELKDALCGAAFVCGSRLLVMSCH